METKTQNYSKTTVNNRL